MFVPGAVKDEDQGPQLLPWTLGKQRGPVLKGQINGGTVTVLFVMNM